MSTVTLEKRPHNTLFTLKNNHSLKTLLLTTDANPNLHNVFSHFRIQSYIESLVEFKFENAKVKIKYVTGATPMGKRNSVYKWN